MTGANSVEPHIEIGVSMKSESPQTAVSSEAHRTRLEKPVPNGAAPEPADHATNRRSFLVGAGVGALGAGLLADVPQAEARGGLTLGDGFRQAWPGLTRGRFPAIPRSNADLKPAKHLQAIANTAGFHFATIEQGGTSLYPAVAQRVNDPEALRVVLSIGPTEAMHFQTWSDKAGNAPPLTDPTNGLVFPDLNKKPFDGQHFQTNLIMPEPTKFLSRKFPAVSIVRPTETKGIAMAVVQFLTAMGLFRGQSPAFFATMTTLAQQADAARRH